MRSYVHRYRSAWAGMTVSGVPFPGEMLTAAMGDCWYRDGVLIPGAFGQSYVVGPRDIGCEIRCGLSEPVTVWHPRDVPGVLDALVAFDQVYHDDGITLATNGQTVRRWRGAGNQNNTYSAGQSTGAAQPLYQENVFGPGLPGVELDGTDDYMNFESGLIPLGTPQYLNVISAYTVEGGLGGWSIGLWTYGVIGNRIGVFSNTLGYRLDVSSGEGSGGLVYQLATPNPARPFTRVESSVINRGVDAKLEFDDGSVSYSMATPSPYAAFTSDMPAFLGRERDNRVMQGKYGAYILVANSVPLSALNYNRLRQFAGLCVGKNLGLNVGARFEGAAFPGETLTSFAAGQWYLDGVPVSGETGDTYQVKLQDMGKRLSQHAAVEPVRIWHPSDVDGVQSVRAPSLGVYHSVAPDAPASEGQTVSEWRDMLYDYPATQGTGANQPIYRANGFGPGLPALEFDGVNDALILENAERMAVSSASHAANHVVLIASGVDDNPSGGSNGHSFVYLSTTLSYNVRLGISSRANGASPARYTAASRGINDGWLGTATGSNSSSTPVVLSSRTIYNSGEGNFARLSLFEDGVATVNTTFGAAGAINNTSFNGTIGNGHNAAAGQGGGALPGKLGCIILASRPFNSAFSPLDLNRLHHFAGGCVGKKIGLAIRAREFYSKLLLSAGGPNIEATGEAEKLDLFSRGLHDLLGYEADFFTFRATQNVGTGATAYSYHGLTATLVNSPTWQANGILFTANNQRVDLGGYLLPANTGEWSWVLVAQGTARVAQASADSNWPFKPVIVPTHWSPSSAYYLAYADSTDSSTWGIKTATFDRGSFHAYYLSKLENGNGANGVDGVIFNINNQGKSSNNFDVAPSNTIRREAAGSSDNQAAFLIRVRKGSQNAEMFAAIYHLYKSTIGHGLGLS